MASLNEYLDKILTQGKVLAASLSKSIGETSSVSDTQKETKPEPVIDEEERIQTFRTTATWMLTTLGAAAALAFTGLAVNKIPNLAILELAVAGYFAIGSVVIGLTAISIMVYYIGQVLVTPSISLKTLSSSTKPNDQWVNDPLVVVPPYKTLKETLEQFTILQDKFSLNSNDKDSKAELEQKYFPIISRVGLIARRKVVEQRFTLATKALTVGTLVVTAAVTSYLASNAYVPASAPVKFVLPTKAVWNPLSISKTSDERATREMALKDELGTKCKLNAIGVIVLSISSDEKSYTVVVQQDGCKLISKNLDVSLDGSINPIK